jgi:uncharacterized protein with HEPN domain
VNQAVVWKIVQEDLPVFKAEIKALLDSLED